MSTSRKDLRVRVLQALVAVAVLIAAGTAVLDVIGNEYRRSLADHIISNLKTMERVLALQQQDSAARVQTIADEPRFRDLTKRLLGDPKERATHDELKSWITPRYQSRGYEDYQLISADGLHVIASGNRQYIGQSTLPSTQEALRLAELTGAAMTRPISARHPVADLVIDNPNDVAYQLSCSRINEGIVNLAFLCLHENPFPRLYRLLHAGRSGLTGDAYVVDDDGQILSPIRFEKNLPHPISAEPGWSLFGLSAHLMQGNEDFTDQPGRSSYTRVVARLLEHDSLQTSLIEDYIDFRGRRVVGAASWLPDTQMGIVIEEEMDEAFRSYNFALNTLVALIGLGVVLIAALTWLDLRSRFSLARSQQQLAAFRDNIPAEIHMKSASGRYLMVNPVFEATFNTPPGHVLGKTDAELYPPEEARCRLAEHREVVRSGKPFRRNQTRQSGADGETTYSVVCFPVRGGDDETVVAVGTVAMNITEQIRTQRELEEMTRTLEDKVVERTEQLAAARDMAEAAGRAKADFLANMSHEIRTPLNAILGMSHLAAHVNTSQRVAHYIERIRSSGQHLLAIVNDVLDISRFEAGKLPIHHTEFSLEGLLSHVADLIGERADAKGLELIIAIEPGLPNTLIGDAMRIGQILINFANNAVKFTDEGEVLLRVSTLNKNGAQITLRFEVEDTGIGITDEQLPLLFSPFQQLDGPTDRGFEGTGLGLAISKNLAELMNAQVSVRSQTGHGSVFALDICLTVSEHVGTTALPQSVQDCARVLVVDDNTKARDQLVKLLRSVGILVDEASHARQAITQLTEAEEHSYDIVFIDWQMPDVNGQQLAEQIHQLTLHGAKPRLVLMASNVQGLPDTISRSLFSAVLAKPMTPSEVLGTITKRANPDHASEDAISMSPVRWDGLCGRRLLVVEDNPINQEVMQGLLELVGAHVSIAHDGLQGMRLLNEQTFDLVLMDINMPVMNGFEAAQMIKQDPRFTNLPVIALTANALGGDRERCLAAGMSDYIAKPIDPNQMFPILLRHLPAAHKPMLHVHKTAHAAPAQHLSNDDVDTMLTAVALIEEINVTEAVSRMMGRRDLYAKLVLRIVAERTGMTETLDQALRSGDKDALHGVIHNAKSTLGALGVDGLKQRAVLLQGALRKGGDISDTPHLEEDILLFSTDLAALLQRLKEASQFCI